MYSRDGSEGEEGAGEDGGRNRAVVEEKGRATFLKAAAAVVLVGNHRERERREISSRGGEEVVSAGLRAPFPSPDV